MFNVVSDLPKPCEEEIAKKIETCETVYVGYFRLDCYVLCRPGLD